MFIYNTASQEDTQYIASVLAKYVQPNTTILLDGELGAGKTTFTKGLAKGLAIHTTIKSPTYTLVRDYQTGTLPLYHMDVYRLEETGGNDLGFEEYFDVGGVVVIEWSQYISNILPTHYLRVTIDRVFTSENERQLTFEPVGNMYKQLIIDLKKELTSKK